MAPRKKTKVDQDYRRELGDDTHARITAEAAQRCPRCWARHGEPHHFLCPDSPPDTTPPTQEEALF